MNINIDRLKGNLLKLAEFGDMGEGEGTTRLAFTPEYKAGKEYVKGLMLEAGMEVYEDPIGNLFGKYKGSRSEQSILIGSHIDTVPNGGMFDGCLGVLGALECARTLKENGYVNNHTIEVVAFIAEEESEIGSTLGSRCIAGRVEVEEEERIFLKSIGLTKEDVAACRRQAESIKNYIELHVEQGGILDVEKISIGVVTGIAGITRYNAQITGESNHSGSTPMSLRDDALVKAARFVQCFDEKVREIGSPLVGTIGRFEIEPGATNVIPGKVNLSIELRDIDYARVQQGVDFLESYAPAFPHSLYHYEREVLLDETIQKATAEACEELGYSYKKIHSGAGHDASIMSVMVPTGMIFVPSIGGISHSPQEKTEWEDIEKGTNVLLKTVMKLDV